jgi:hypothetical protein
MFNITSKHWLKHFNISRRQLLANLGLATISLFLSLIIVELSLRSISPPNSRNPAEFRIPHPTLGWVLEPDASYLYDLPEATVHVTYNSAGWRDLEHTIKKPKGSFRILVLGDSFMEAYSVELNESFHRRVEDLARSIGRDIEVINLGVASYGTLQEYLVFQDIGRQYKPDLVLLGFFVANDVMNNSLELEAMLGAERPQRIARPYLDPIEPILWTITPGDFEGIQRHYKEERAYIDAQRQTLTHRLIILRMARAGLKKLHNLIFQEGQVDIPEQTDKARQELALLGVNYCVEPAEYTRAWDTTERILARLNADVEAAGGKLVVFTVPALEEVSVILYEKVATNIVYHDRLCLEGAPGHTRLGSILAQLDIELITLLPDFRRVMREDGIQLYRISDQHWNPEGHALAAEHVVSELIKRELLILSGK